MTDNPLGLQLYTMREMAEKDFVGMLRKVGEAGYRAVEFAGYGNLQAKDLRALLDQLGLRTAATHISLDALENSFEAVTGYAKVLGTQFLVVGGAPPEYRVSADGWKQFARRMEETGTKCRSYGFTLCYHNHHFEFEVFDGKTGYEWLFSESSPDAVHAEIDTYWAQVGGHNPAALIRSLRGRVPLIHMKDQSRSNPNMDAEVGEGSLDWAGILAAAAEAETQWYIVEQEDCQRPVEECIKTSLANARRMGLS